MRRPWAWPYELRRHGILGINRRNGEYVLPGNPREYYPRVDDKQITKQICHARQIPVPDTYALIQRHGDIPKFLDLIGRRPDFVIKPASGSEGRGIVVIASHDRIEFRTSSEERLLFGDLTYHLAEILAGLYSLGGQPDMAIIEQRIVRHAAFERIAVGGTPDIRVVLYHGIPVMAMIRLPTRASRGRANLHQGAVAAGVHLVTGRTFGGVCMDRAVSVHPDTGQSICGLQIPGWDAVLTAAMKLAQCLELGYLGIDFVLDAHDGPVVLEANARPGLNIQVANRCGLLPRLRWIDAQSPDMLLPQRREEVIERLAATGSGSANQ
ncbi:MAG: alpha-L-glutamate ligase-like protein [Thermoguttaceae bacterium]|jgi:alpha-L-glutamate ligase-like protein